MPDETNAKKILTASLLQNWRRPPGCLCTKWMKTKLSLNEAIDMAQNRQLWRLVSTFGAYALLVMHVTK